MAQTKDKHFELAHKHIQRGRHQFVMTLAKQGFKQPEISGVLKEIDWSAETEWLAQEYRDKEEAEKNPTPKPVPIPPPPGDAPQVQ